MFCRNRSCAHIFAIIALAVGLWPHSAWAQCGFAIEPAAVRNWYRSDGWEIPGLSDAKTITHVNVSVDKKVPDWPDGVTVSLVVHDQGYRVTFPEALFEEDGVRKKMLRREFGLAQLVRWEMNGRTYAYSYELLPFDVACTASVDIVDDKGDGKFRLMTSWGHSLLTRHPEPPPIPEWLQKPKS